MKRILATGFIVAFATFGIAGAAGVDHREIHLPQIVVELLFDHLRRGVGDIAGAGADPLPQQLGRRF